MSTVLGAAAAFGLVVFVDDRPAFVTRVTAPHQRDRPGLDGLLETNGRHRTAEFAPIGKSKPQHSGDLSLSRDNASRDLGKPLDLGFEGADALLANAVWAREQTARATHRDHLRRNGVFVFHGYRSESNRLAVEKRHDLRPTCRRWWTFPLHSERYLGSAPGWRGGRPPPPRRVSAQVFWQLVGVLIDARMAHSLETLDGSA